MPSQLRGRTALVTGAARRVGRATALALARAGVSVVVHYHRSRDEAHELCRELSGLGVGARPVHADFRSSTEVGNLVEQAAQPSGHLDLLVNNASIFPRDTLEDVSFESVVANVQVNAWAPFVLSREFALRVGQGCIVNLIDSRIDDFDWTHVGYMLSKHMLVVLTRAMALQYAPKIRVNGVAPGLILAPRDEGQEYLERLGDTVPLKRHGEPEDVAEAVVFLARSDYLTGEIVYVDGGRHLREYKSR